MKIRAVQSWLLSCILLVCQYQSSPGGVSSPIQADARSLVLFSRAAVHWGWLISELSSGWKNTIFR